MAPFQNTNDSAAVLSRAIPLCLYAIPGPGETLMNEVTAVRRYTAETADVKYLVDGYLSNFGRARRVAEYTEGINYHVGVG